MNATSPSTMYLCHDDGDIAICRSIARGLRSRGYAVWFYEQRAAYTETQLAHEIAQCSSFVVLLTPHAVRPASPVMDEIHLERTLRDPERQRLLLPVLVRRCRIPPLLTGLTIIAVDRSVPHIVDIVIRGLHGLPPPRSFVLPISRRVLLAGIVTITIGGVGFALWNEVHPLPLIYRGHRAAVNGVDWSSDGTLIATASSDTTVHVWDARTGQLRQRFTGHSAAVRSLAWFQDRLRLISAGDDGQARLWNWQSGETLSVIDGTIVISGYQYRIGAISTVALAADDQDVALAGDQFSDVQIDALGSHHIYEYTQLITGVHGPAWSPITLRLAAAVGDGTAQIWDALTGDHLQVYRGHAGDVLSIAWAPDGRLIATGGNDNTAQVWDPLTLAPVTVFRGHSGVVSALSWSPDSQSLASGGADQTVRIWNAGTGHQSFVYRGHTDWVRSVAWAPDGRHIASAGDDHTAQVWQPS